MNALIGLSRETNGSPILELFARLGFEDCRATLAYVADDNSQQHHHPFGRNGSSATATLERTECLSAIEKDANQMLDEARANLYESGIHATHVILHGHPATALMEAGDQLCTDLICATATKQGALRCAVFGSVCRALTIHAKESVLISKGVPEGNKPFTAVLAIDHSPYCEKALDRLIEMNPMGIQKLIVMTAVAPREYDELWSSYDLPESEQATLRFDRDRVLARNAEIAQRFRGRNIEASVAVLDLPVRESINQVMTDNNADLLIMASQGHGFVERLTIGSLTLHEAVAETHSLLIVRP